VNWRLGESLADDRLSGTLQTSISLVPMSDRKVVWVLGSGFSKSLGGPLLNELMTPERLERLKKPYWLESHHAGWERMHGVWTDLVAHYRTSLDPKNPRPWRDAEEYIEMLSAAGENQAPAFQIMVELTLGDGLKYPKTHNMLLPFIAQHAAKWLAAVTYEFTAVSDTKSERWQPYVNWAKQLGDNDEVITFNYDRAVELATAAAWPKPDDCNDWHSRTRFHKLHGSVDEFFIRERPETLTRIEDPKQIVQHLCEDDKEVALGVPGPGKLSYSTRLFADRWQSAEKALQEATAIVFVGYRFPPTDSYAKRILLQALGNNVNEHILLHTVLGPRKDDDLQRLDSLLRWSMSNSGRVDLDTPGDPHTFPKTFSMRRQPLWAEDFMAVFERKGLFR
jgi:hypothetical protein